jgi:hypothetical protein
MQRRLDLLERENQRLRDKLDPMLGPDNPCFHPQIFQKVMKRNMVMVMIPLWLVFLVGMLATLPRSPLRSMSKLHIGSVPVFDLAGSSSGMPGIGFGIVAFGGLSVGVIAVGGMAVGLVALGGGALGVIAIGGGSVGLIALGGGACGLIAVGGTAFGYRALGQRAYGKYALGFNRQDPEAIEFFVRFFPGLRAAVTTAMPVIPLGPETRDA